MSLKWQHPFPIWTRPIFPSPAIDYSKFMPHGIVRDDEDDDTEENTALDVLAEACCCRED